MLLTKISQDCEAYRLSGDEAGWQLVGPVDTKARPGTGSVREESALNKFRQMDIKGSTKNDTQLQTVHQNTISTLRVYEEAGGSVRKFSSKLPTTLVSTLLSFTFWGNGQLTRYRLNSKRRGRTSRRMERVM